MRGWHEFPKLSAQEIELCHRTFMMIDKNASGCICADQLKLALAILGQQPTEEELFVMIAQVDQDGSREIDFKEFIHAIQIKKAMSARPGSDQETIDAFVALGGNADMSGHISTSRLLSVVQEFELTLNVDKLLAELDADSSAQIGYELFKQLLA
ncbi:dynein 18 kDa light chain, flagellar outer arm [Haematococcus lacustris]